MGKNYMPEVAKMLGVELGEEFEVSGWNGKFMFDKSGLRIKYLGCLEEEAETTLYQLLDGTEEIVRRPWKPKNGAGYWFVNAFYEGVYTVEDSYYNGSISDINRILLGNCFPTREAAEAAAPDILKFYEDVRKMVEEE